MTPKKPEKLNIDRKNLMKRLKQTGLPAWQAFCHDFEELLNSNHPSAVSLRFFICRSLHQFRLTSVDELDILMEVLLRAYKLIVLGGGTVIRHPTAWVRRTAFNHIRELSRSQKRTDPLRFDISDQSAPLIDHLILEADLDIIKRALHELNPDEQRLLTLKIIDELSWAEIMNVLAGEGKIVPETALRKQKERALKHLRQVYHALRPLSELERELGNK